MSVTGYMYNINAQNKIRELELQEGLEGNRSWHHRFKDSAYIYIGGLDPKLTEGDVVIVFSQFGEIVDVNMIRDRATGKSKGFCFICYEDQRSTILATDNMNGAQLLKRTLRVDHVEKYKAPKNLDEDNLDEKGDPTLLEYKATGAEGAGHGVYNAIDEQKKFDDIMKDKMKHKKKENERVDDDEAWADAFESSLKDQAEKDELKQGGKKIKKEEKKAKKAKKEAKAAKKAAKSLKKELKKAKKQMKKSKNTKSDKRSAKEEMKDESSSSSSSS